MAYCDLTDILGVIPELELTQLTDDSVPPVMVNQSAVDQAIAAAETLINGYIGSRYPLPLSSVPELINTIALDITVYKLYLRRKKKMPPEPIVTGYEDAKKLLKDIQGGRISLGVDKSGVETKPVSGGVSFSSNERVMSRDSLKGL